VCDASGHVEVGLPACGLIAQTAHQERVEFPPKLLVESLVHRWTLGEDAFNLL